MGRTLAQTISDCTRKHLLENNGLLFSQCTTAVGWIGGTVPELTEDQGIVELPTSDSSNGGVACGAALAGRRPIYIVRYQGFMWYNAVSLINYAAKSKEIWGVPCPVFIRSIGMESNGIGPVASSCQHGMFMRMPGIPICAPMTPVEWESCWNWYLNHDDPVYVSEHRRGFVLSDELPNIINEEADITIIAISAARLNSVQAVEQLKSQGIICNLIHCVWLKPFEMTEEMIKSVSETDFTIVIDSDFQICGASEHIAYTLMHKTNRIVHSYGLSDKTCGVAPFCENCTPSVDEIINKVKFLQGEKNDSDE